MAAAAATEELKLVVDDTQLNLALTKITQIKQAQSTATGQLRGLSTLITRTRQSARAAGIQLDDLPTLNRDMRLILGATQLPWFRQASALLFQARRGVRAQQLKREAEALKAAGLAPGVAGELGTAALIGQVALMVFVVTALARTIQNMQGKIDQSRERYETLVRTGLGLTHKEYEQLSKEAEFQQQIGFATLFDQYFVEQEGTLRELWTAWMAEWIATVGPFIPGDAATGVPDWVQGGMEDEWWTSWGYDQIINPDG